MKLAAILVFVSMLLGNSAYAGGRTSVGSLVFAEKQAGDVSAVMYMTSW